MDFSTLSIGQRIGIKYNHCFAQFPYRIGQIEGETTKYWIVGIDYYSKTTGKIRGKGGDRCLVPYEEAAREIILLNQRKEQEQFQAIAQTLKCQFSESFVFDLKQLIEKHRC